MSQRTLSRDARPETTAKEYLMRWFRRKHTQQQLPCPQCTMLLPVDADKCDLCGADIDEFPERRPFPVQEPTGSRRVE